MGFISQAREGGNERKKERKCGFGAGCRNIGINHQFRLMLRDGGRDDDDEGEGDAAAAAAAPARAKERGRGRGGDDESSGKAGR